MLMRRKDENLVLVRRRLVARRGTAKMIRFVGKSLGIAVNVVIMGTAGVLVVCAQNGFDDDAGLIPPSPAPPPSAATRIGMGLPSPALAAPSQSTSTTVPSAAYNLTRLPQATKGAARSNAPASPAPQAYGVNRSVQSKIGPYGVGGRRPEPGGPAVDASRKLTQATHASGQNAAGDSVKTAGHFDEINDPGFVSPVPPPMAEAGPGPLFQRTKPLPDSGMSFPTERMRPPTIMGSHLGLQPGETATERSLRLMSAVGELERQVESLDQRNAELNQHIKQRDDQLLLAIREIKSARKEVTSARDELEHLRQQVAALQDKVRDAERDNAALLQTMAPLLQKLLETDGTNSPTDEARE